MPLYLQEGSLNLENEFVCVMCKIYQLNIIFEVTVNVVLLQKKCLPNFLLVDDFFINCIVNNIFFTYYGGNCVGLPL